MAADKFNCDFVKSFGIDVPSTSSWTHNSIVLPPLRVKLGLKLLDLI